MSTIKVKLSLALTAFLLAILAHAGVVRAAPQCSPERAPLTEFGLHYAIGKRLTAAIPTYSVSRTPPGVDVRYTRVLIKPSTPIPKAGWKLIIRDGQLRPVQVIDSRNFSADLSAVWSDRLPTPYPTLSLVLDDHLSNFYVDIPAYDAMPEKAENPYYSTKTSIPDWKDLYGSSFGTVPPEIRPLGESVGLLTSFEGSSFTGYATWCCSGSVISTEPTVLFLTNFHCGGRPDWSEAQFWDQRMCDNTIIDMSWDNDNVSMEYACKHVVKVNPKLDAAVLEIAPMTLGGSPARPVRIRMTSPASGESLKIIHHPQCLPKSISQQCMVMNAAASNWRNASEKTDFTHRCDSEGGSSGAPVFDQDGNLVGLHHLGFEHNDAGQCDNTNKAVATHALLNFLQGLPITTVASPN